MKKGTLNPENFISPVQVPLVEYIIEFCALKLHFDFCPINARKPLKYQGFSGFVLISRTVMSLVSEKELGNNRGFSLKFANNIFIFNISCQFASNVLCSTYFYSVIINNKNLIIGLLQ